MSEVPLYSSCVHYLNKPNFLSMGGDEARGPQKVSSQILLNGWMYKGGLSECIYFVRLIPLHPWVPLAP